MTDGVNHLVIDMMSLEIDMMSLEGMLSTNQVATVEIPSVQPYASQSPEATTIHLEEETHKVS
jgi:hypothetical protein